MICGLWIGSGCDHEALTKITINLSKQPVYGPEIWTLGLPNTNDSNVR
jgi:hypothetical protein